MMTHLALNFRDFGRQRSLCCVLLAWTVGLISFALPVRAADEPVEPLKVAIVVFPGVELLDFAGPAEVLASARDEEMQPYFEVFTVGPSKQPIKSMRFLALTPQHDPGDAPKPDLVVLPGGNVETVMNHPELLAWIANQHDAGCTLFSICNGASILAKLGYLSGLEVATHHDNIPLLELLDPQAKCRPDCKFVDNGKIVTAAGISSGIDAALYVVGRLQGEDVARRVAEYVEYDHYAGFQADAETGPRTDTNGVVTQRGRVHEHKPWAIVRLIRMLREEGTEKTLAAYPAFLESTSGTDRDMLSSAGISMSVNWLLKHSRDPQQARSLMEFNVAANPDSLVAHLDLAKALLADGDKPGAKRLAERALVLAPDNARAKKLLAECE